ncbi:MAG: YwbE family protein [bacterium]|nr:YwbE family protein [bacterium]
MNDGQNRADIYPGLEVDIVLKKDQKTGTLTRGIVKNLLTSKAIHPRGIKVRLEDGQVGRVQNIIGSDSSVVAEDDEFDNFI